MTEPSNPLLPVVLCGGSGTRLWPLSRETYPKQFLALTGARTMLQETALRLQGLSQIPVAKAPILVCNTEHRFLAASQLMDAGISDARVVLEPTGRNTAPALTLAAMQAQADGGDPVLLAMPADHVIGNLPAFHSAIEKAFAIASNGAMVTFGVVADKPETGYGYIQCGQAMEGSGAHHIASFAEKPDAAHAQSYLDAGNYLWNSGLFMVRTSVWLRAIQSCRPDISAACQAAMQNAQKDVDFIRPETEAFNACPSDSIDYAVMEQLPARPDLGIPACVVPLQADWSDLGAWDALWNVLDRDTEDNATTGEAVLHDCSGSLVLSSSRLVAGIGLNNIVVIETPDAVLVTEKSRAQDVKHLFAKLKIRNHETCKLHRTVHRPWGTYTVLEEGSGFKIKRIEVKPGASLSLQMHRHRSEHWVVVSGFAKVVNGERETTINTNESTFIPAGQKHRLTNPGETTCVMIEVQSGQYVGEDDIVRFEDIYGRAVDPV